MTGYVYLNGVIAADGADWYVKETPTGSDASPGADAQIYRWSGSAWVQQGRVDQLPTSLNYFQAISGGWFEAITTAGSTTPEFTMQGANGPGTTVLSDLGGKWHVRTAQPLRSKRLSWASRDSGIICRWSSSMRTCR